MFDRLLNQSAAPLLEKSASFHAARHQVLAENLVNISTPGYRQKDLDVDGFRSQLRRRLADRDASPSGTANLNGITPETQTPRDTLEFHDGANRSVEELMTEQAKNALQHNLAVELLRKQYALFDMALRERVA